MAISAPFAALCLIRHILESRDRPSVNSVIRPSRNGVRAAPMIFCASASATAVFIASLMSFASSSSGIGTATSTPVLRAKILAALTYYATS